MKNDFEVFMFADALGWELVQRHAFLQNELPSRRSVEMQFGYSCSAVPTILTGKRPKEHGHLSLFEFAPDRSPFGVFRYLAPLLKPDCLWNRGRVRHRLSQIVKKLYGFTGYFQLYAMPFDRLAMMDYCEKKDIFARHGMAPAVNLADMAAKLGVRGDISDWRLSDKENIEAGKNAVRSGAEFIFIYTAELDGVLHQFVNEPEIIQAKLDWYAAEVREILNVCRERGGNWRFTLFSDHGMTPLTGTADIKGAVERTGLVFGKDYGGCFDSTLFRPVFLRSDAEKVIMEAVKPFEKQGHWLTMEEEKNTAYTVPTVSSGAGYS